MKNATKHAATLKSLYRRLCKQHPAEDRPQLDPFRALVLGVLREDCDDGRAQRAMSTLDAEFVDVNELRVATELELTNLIGEDYPDVLDRALRLRELLMSLFDTEGRLSIVRVAAMNKKDQRSALRGLPMMTPFVEGHMSMLGFGQAAVPVDASMLAYLASSGALESETTAEEAQRFLEAHLKSDECWPFFASCRQAASRGKRRATARARSGSRAAPRKVAKATSKTRAARRTTRQPA